MPVYEYQCETCKKVVEVLYISIPKEGEEVNTCIECDGNMKKLVSQSSFALKGDCWMRDGYSRTGLQRKGKT